MRIAQERNFRYQKLLFLYLQARFCLTLQVSQMFLEGRRYAIQYHCKSYPRILDIEILYTSGFERMKTRRPFYLVIS
jgi:hypothetical protein